jgi:toxin-antitoxin system PIN domain toxin
MPQHPASQAWLDERLSGNAKVGLPWHSLLAFLRIVSNPRLFRPPTSTGSAWRQVQGWLALPSVWIPSPTDRHPETLSRLLEDNVSSALVADAHLAALAIEHGLTVCSTDRDFASFQGVRWENPLTGAHS